MRNLILALTLTLFAAPAFAQVRSADVLELGSLAMTPAIAEDGGLVYTMQLTETIRKSTPFWVQADQPAEDDPADAVTGFRLYVNGSAVQTLTAGAAGCNSFPCSPIFSVPGGMNKGTYVIFIESFNADGAAQSSSITLVVTAAPPKPPANIRIKR